jgi:hypothetical protein
VTEVEVVKAEKRIPEVARRVETQRKIPLR